MSLYALAALNNIGKMIPPPQESAPVLSNAWIEKVIRNNKPYKAAPQIKAEFEKENNKLRHEIAALKYRMEKLERKLCNTLN